VPFADQPPRNGSPPIWPRPIKSPVRSNSRDRLCRLCQSSMGMRMQQLVGAGFAKGVTGALVGPPIQTRPQPRASAWTAPGSRNRAGPGTRPNVWTVTPELSASDDSRQATPDSLVVFSNVVCESEMISPASLDNCCEITLCDSDNHPKPQPLSLPRLIFPSPFLCKPLLCPSGCASRRWFLSRRL
jgi:hypothetical protein